MLVEKIRKCCRSHGVLGLVLSWRKSRIQSRVQIKKIHFDSFSLEILFKIFPILRLEHLTSQSLSSVEHN